MDLLDSVRAACAEVAGRARHVTIDEARLAAYVHELPPAETALSLDPKHHWHGGEEDTALFVITLDAINFGSGWWPVVRKRPGLSGYFTMAASLKDEYERAGPIRPERLAALTVEDCARVFGQEAAGDAGELMGHFRRALNDLGRLLREHYDASAAALVEQASGSAARLAELLCAMPYYRDVTPYRGIDVPLYKRAQLTSADLALALPRSPLGRFHDLDRLTVFADNLVPHVLRVDGVLSYTPELAARIDREELLEPGSEEEVEIRACAVHAVELMVASLRAGGVEAAAMGLDYVLWNRGQRPEIKAIPRHRARSIYY
jgi:hypothetical protein